MKLPHISKLSIKLTLTVGAIMIIFMTADLLLSLNNTRQTSVKEIERWSLLLAETVRVSLNTLMKEERMDARFEMFDAIRLEIPGLEKVRVIRAPKVNEIFLKTHQQRDIPIEQEAIEDYRNQIATLTQTLATTKDPLEQQDLRMELAEAREGIASAEKKIQQLTTIKSDARELPVSALDHQILTTGKPIFQTEGDTLRVWAPYIARKTCGAASGCHSGVNEGDVLGAVHMQFSLAKINRDLIKDALLAVVGKLILVLLIIGSLIVMINFVVIRNIHIIHAALKKFSSGDLSGRIRVRGKDEVQDLAQGINVFIDRFVEMLDQVQQEKQSAQENEERLKVVIDNAGEGIITVDAKGEVHSFNSAAETIFGCTASEAIGRNIAKFIPEFLNESIGEWELRARRTSGEEFPIEVSVRDAHMRSISLFVCILRDITERKVAEKKLNQLANFDSLTDLPNRNLFKDRLAQAISRAERNQNLAALLFLDVDRFKIINDTLGHDAGDQLLQHVARTLTGILRKSDTIATAGPAELSETDNESTIARLGGDEFIVIVEGFRKEEFVATIAQKIIDAFAKPVYLAGNELYVSVSVGIAIYPVDDTSQEGLIKAADSAMYRAKESGRNTYQFYTKGLNSAVSDKFRLERDLRHAIENNEFVLYYQPKVDMTTSEIIGAEALMRWHRPGKGLILPDEFISALEETGLIVSVGDWVLRTACAQSRAWQKEGIQPLKMAVNFSARQLKQKDTVERVLQILREVDLKPEFLELELTESILMEHSDFNITTLNEFARQGVMISIDDFGTGYSSLSYLKRFSIHALKIDQSFVQDIVTNPDDAAIATAVIALGTSLRLKVIAEGIETQEQFELLRALGCHHAQGYLLGRPMDAESFIQHVRDYSRQIPARQSPK